MAENNRALTEEVFCDLKPDQLQAMVNTIGLLIIPEGALFAAAIILFKKNQVCAGLVISALSLILCVLAMFVIAKKYAFLRITCDVLCLRQPLFRYLGLPKKAERRFYWRDLSEITVRLIQIEDSELLRFEIPDESADGVFRFSYDAGFMPMHLRDFLRKNSISTKVEGAERFKVL